MNASTAAVPVAQFRPGLPAELDPGPGGIDGISQELPRPERQMLGLGLHPGLVGHLAVELVDRRLLAGTDVAQQPAPLGGGPHEGIDHVVDVDEVAGLVAVTEDGHLLAPQEALGEDRHHAGLAVGILAGAVDVGQGQGRELERVHLAVGDQVVDDRLLRDPVGGQGPVGQGLLQRELRLVGLAVQSPATGCEDHPLRPGEARPLEYPEGPEHVHIGVEHRIGDRDADIGLGGEMEDDFRKATAHQRHDLGGAHVHLVDGELVAGRGAGVGQIGQGAGGEIVDHVHRVPFGQKPVHQRRTDEPCPAGDQRAQRLRPPRRSVRRR